MLLLKLLLIIACAIFLTLGKNEKYKAYKVFKVTPTNDEQLKSLWRIEESIQDADTWVHPSINGPGYIVVPPKSIDPFTKLMKMKGIDHRVEIEDVEIKLNEEDEELEESKEEPRWMMKSDKRDIGYNRYYRYKEIDEYLDYLGETYPDKVRVYPIGKSYEGRNLKYVHVSGSGFQDPNKTIIYVDGCHHAREWISIPVVTYVLRKLLQDVTEYDVNMDVDWVVMPLVNPDGYEYSHTNDRMWRKTRSINTDKAEEKCKGADPNRNYDFQWMYSGSSDDPCNFQTYAGPEPFSESESRAVRDILKNYTGRIQLYLTVHSYANMIIYPWGYDGSMSPNSEELDRVGRVAAAAIDEASPFFARKYKVGNSADLLGKSSGAADDYAKYVGVPLSYTLELPGGRPLFGFVVPAYQIRQFVKETWEGFVAFAREVKQLYG